LLLQSLMPLQIAIKIVEPIANLIAIANTIAKKLIKVFITLCSHSQEEDPHYLNKGILFD